MKKKIMVVEDEPAILLGLEDNLKQQGYQVLPASTGAEAQKSFEGKSPDLVLLDLMLPDASGYNLCKDFKIKNPKIPIIMLTAKSEEIDKVLGLEIGADDYITKPFSLRELLARIHAVLRRYSTQYSDQAEPVTTCTLGKLTINFDKYEAYRGSKAIRLTKLEFEILRFLIKNRGRVVSREELLNNIWGYDSFPTTRTIDNFIVRIRKMVEEKPASPKIIISVRGVGYRIADEEKGK